MTYTELQNRMFADLDNPNLMKKSYDYSQDYLQTVRDRTVQPTEEAVNSLNVFDESLSETGDTAESILAKLHLIGSPATMAQNAGRYYGFVNGATIPVGQAVRQLSDVWDQNAALYVMSPVTMHIERIVEGWLTTLFDFPEGTAASFVSGTTIANLTGLAAARYKLLRNLGWDTNKQGIYGAPKLRVILGRAAHSSAIRALNLLGFGTADFEWVDQDEQGRLIAEKLPTIDNKCLVLLQAGNVNTGAFDPFEKVMDRVEGTGAWVHIDGAFGLWGAVSDKFKNECAGLNRADSWAVDGHKTLNTTYDSGVAFCKDRDALVSALHATGEYLIYGDRRDGMLYTPEMSRRGRATEIWGILKFLGKEGLSTMIEGLHTTAQYLAKGLEESGYTILNKVVFNQVLIAAATEEQTTAALRYIQEDRTCWCGPSKWHGKAAIRLSVCSWKTTKEDIDKTVGAFQRAMVSTSS